MARRWSAADRETLRREYGTTPTPGLAARLGRTPAQVRQAAKRFCRLRPHRRLADHREAMLALHAAGASTPAIARAMAVPLRTVEFWLGRLGLRGNGWSRESLESRRRKRMGAWLAANERLIWKALERHIPGGDPAARVNAKYAREDLFQQAFLRCLKYGHKYDPRRASMTTWLYLQVHSAVSNALRRKELPTVPLEGKSL